jgi:DNA-binding MarR family transcriptional regulator
MPSRPPFPHLDPGETPPSVAFLLSKLGFEVRRDLGARLRPLDLELRQFGLLQALARADGASQRALGAMLEIPANRMVALVDDLEHKGLVERRPHPSDRRAYSLALTDKGSATLARAFEAAFGLEAEICSPLDAAERTQLLALLRKVAAHSGGAPGFHPGLAEPDSADDV